GDILFGKFGLPGGTKTRTGQWSTGARTLEDLAEQGHELPRKILDWRQVSKLRSTYTDALPGHVNPVTHLERTSDTLAPTPAGWHRPSRTYRTSRSAPRKAARFAAPSWRRPAPSSPPPTIRKSSCGSWPKSPASTRSRRRSARASTSTP